MLSVGAVIVAAGMSSRMGDFKPLLKIGDRAIIEHVIWHFKQAGVEPIVVVTGHRGDELEAYLTKTDVVCLRNPEYEHTQMSDSAAIGFCYLMERCERIFFTPGDVPLFSTDTVKKLMETDADVVKPVCDGQDGHPILIRSGILPELMEETKSCGLSRSIDRLKCDKKMVIVRDEGILYDADNPEEFKEMTERYQQNR